MQKIVPMIVVCAVLFCTAAAPVCYAANDLFGMQVKGGDENSFTISGYSNNEVKFKQVPGKTNADIYAWAKLGASTIDICVTNESGAPISTNYFLDTFTLIAADNKIYYLDKGEITRYPGSAYINPGEKKCYSPLKPARFQNRQEIKLILCDLGAAFERTTIIVKPLPETAADVPAEKEEETTGALLKDRIRKPSDLVLLNGRKRVEIEKAFGPPTRRNTYDINGEAVTLFFDSGDVCSGYAK